MSYTKVKFDSKKEIIIIEDEAKTVHYFFCVFVILQLLTNGLQVYGNWGKFDNWPFYLFCVLFATFIGFAIFYFFFNAYDKEIAIKEIQYYKEMPFLWSKLRFFKLKNNKVRLINFTKKSTASELLHGYLTKYQISIKS